MELIIHLVLLIHRDYIATYNIGQFMSRECIAQCELRLIMIITEASIEIDKRMTRKKYENDIYRIICK